MPYRAKRGAEGRYSTPVGSEPYKAFEHGRHGKNAVSFEVVDSDGEVTGIDYPYRMGWRFRGTTGLNIRVSWCVVIIEGVNLDQLRESLVAKAIDRLTCFSPALHQPPAEGEARIDRLTVIEVAQPEQEP